MSTPEFGTDALLRRLGDLARQRRGEFSATQGRIVSRGELAKRAGIGSDATIRDFEQGRRLPQTMTQRKLEKVLEWRLGSIGDIMGQVNRKASEITMEDVDAYDSSEDPKALLHRIPLEVLLDEVQERLSSLRTSVSPQARPVVPDTAKDLYDLAASSNSEHLEDEEERRRQGE